MIKLVTAQATKLRQGGTPDHDLVEKMAHVRDELRYAGAIITESSEYWPDQSQYNAHFYADRAVGTALDYIRNSTYNTTATDATMKRLTADTLVALEKVEGYLS